jgi:hypothetical protein
MNSGQAHLPYVDKWQAHWPEQAILDVFVPAPQKPLARLWGGLLFALHESAFVLEHDTVREQKSHWWARELQAAGQGSATHPITQALREFPADYASLAAPMLSLARQAPIRAGDRKALADVLRPFSQAVVRIERQLFGGRDDSNPDSVSAQWLVMRLPQGLQAFDRGLVPMNLLARHQGLEHLIEERPLLKDWLVDLDGLLPAEPGSNWYRAAQSRFTQRRIRQLRAAKPPGIRPGHAWDAWRAMRVRSVD